MYPAITLAYTEFRGIDLNGLEWRGRGGRCWADAVSTSVGLPAKVAQVFSETVDQWDRYLPKLCQGCSRVYSKVTGVSLCLGSFCVVRVE